MPPEGYAQRSAPSYALTRPDRPALRITRHCSLGGVASPVLSNIYLDRLDKFVETQLLPQYNRGERRAPNPAYEQVTAAIRQARKRGDRAAVRALRQHRRILPSMDLHDPGSVQRREPGRREGATI